MPAEIVFRCDASPAIGGGHVMRCLTAAGAFDWAGWQCRFAVNHEALATVPALARSGYQIDIVDTASAGKIQTQDYKTIVIDNYAIDAEKERKLTPTGSWIVVFDDLANRRHDCDLLVDPTPQRKAADYEDFVASGTQLLLGPQYALVQQRWRDAATASRVRIAQATHMKRILVSMGATDPANATGAVIEAIVQSAVDADVDIVLGSAAPHANEIRRQMTKRFTLHIDPPDLPEIAARCDFAIGAAGTSGFERAVLGLPTIAIQTADNQRFNLEGFAASGASIALPGGLDKLDELASLIRSLANDPENRAAMSQAAAAMTDGRGAVRLLLALSGKITTAANAPVTLVLADERDRDWLLDLQSEPQTRRFARSPHIPTAAEHANWFAATLGDKNKLLAIVVADGERAGMIRLDRKPNTAFEVSIAISDAWHRKGIGAAALALVRRVIPTAELLATVLPENSRSAALFTQAGYVRSGTETFTNRSLDNGVSNKPLRRSAK